MNKILTLLICLASITAHSQVQYISITSGQNIITCLSTDVKPTAANNDILFETNTGKIFFNNSGVWTCSTCLTYATVSGMQNRLASTDTGVMLSPYLRSDIAVSTYVPKTTTINGRALSGNISITASDLSLGNVTNESKATMFTNATFTGTFTAPNTTITNGMLAGSIAASKLIGTDIATTGKITNYNGIATVGNGVPSLVATIDATTQAANIATATLYAVPANGAGMYRVSVYITVTQAATTSSTMPSTTITYTDGNSGTNTHSTTTTATSAGNSVTTTFAQTTYILYAKASTNIQYATGSYASSGATPMQYALRVKVEAL